jgi:hypothetical protein
MRSISLSELANKVVFGQAADFVKNLLHLLSVARMSAHEAYHHSWLSLLDKRSMSSAERSNISHSLSQSRTRTSSMSNEVFGHYSTPQATNIQRSDINNQRNQRVGHRSLNASSSNHREFSHEKSSFLIGSDHQIELTSSNVHISDRENSQGNDVVLRQKTLEVKMHGSVRASILRAIQCSGEQREDKNSRCVAKERQSDGKVQQAKVAHKREIKTSNSVEAVYS